MTLNVLFKNIGIFAFVFFLQVLLLNNIHFTELGVTPYFYIIFILLLPFDTPKWSLLLSAFFLGLFVDMFEDTGGVHASATVFVAFVRPFLLKVLSGRDGYSLESLPRISWYGFLWFLKFTLISVLIHNFVYFLVLEFSFANFSILLAKIFLTSVLSVVLIIISQYLIFQK